MIIPFYLCICLFSVWIFWSVYLHTFVFLSYIKNLFLIKQFSAALVKCFLQLLYVLLYCINHWEQSSLLDSHAGSPNTRSTSTSIYDKTKDWLIRCTVYLCQAEIPMIHLKKRGLWCSTWSKYPQSKYFDFKNKFNEF